MQGELLYDGKWRTRIGAFIARPLVILACLEMGCGPGSTMEVPTNPVKLPVPFHAEGKHHRLDVVIGSAEVEPMETAILSLKDSVRIEVERLDGKNLATVRAKSGFSLQPYQEVSLRGFIWECEDGSEITGEELVWKRKTAPPIHIPGEFEITTSQGLVHGEDLRGDLFLRQYEIMHVKGVVYWDEIAGDSITEPQ